MERRRIFEKEMIRWLPALLLAVLGMVFYFFVSGCSFLGIVFWVIALICAGYAALGVWKKHKPKAAAAVRRGVSILLMVVLLASAITLVPILRGPAEAEGDGDYVIVLGCRVRGTEPSQCLRDRINRAYDYLTDNPEAICVATGGMGNDEDISEAQCIYNYLTAMGIDGSRIWMEDQATSTIENFRYSIALIQEKTGKTPETVTVLSNEFHLYRASIMAKDCGLQADFVAAPTSRPLIRIS